eukprot:9330080-Karenia_brevis.AAC.1
MEDATSHVVWSAQEQRWVKLVWTMLGKRQRRRHRHRVRRLYRMLSRIAPLPAEVPLPRFL